MADISPANRRMTYAELAEARGISPTSAERLARRRRWQKQIGNDGMARVLVPVGEDRKAADVRPGHPGGSPGMMAIPDIREAIREAVTPLAAQLEHERSRANRAEQRLDEERTRTADATAAERIARDEAAGLRAELDARKRWGLWRRVRGR